MYIYIHIPFTINSLYNKFHGSTCVILTSIMILTATTTASCNSKYVTALICNFVIMGMPQILRNFWSFLKTFV